MLARKVIKSECSCPGEMRVSASFTVESACDVVNMTVIMTSGLCTDPHKVYIYLNDLLSAGDQ